MGDELDDLDASEPRTAKPRGTAKGSAVPRSEKGAKALSGFGRVGEPLSPGEARRALYHSHVALAGGLGSNIQLRETDFETQGDALADMSNHLFPAARLLLRATSPLVFIGAEVGILREIIEGIDEDAGAKRLWSRLQRRSKEKPQGLYVVPVDPNELAG